MWSYEEDSRWETDRRILLGSVTGSVIVSGGAVLDAEDAYAAVEVVIDALLKHGFVVLSPGGARLSSALRDR